MKRAMFRTDASAAIGGGHVMRCLTLADELRGEGWHCVFASSTETVKIVPALLKSGHEVTLPDTNREAVDVLIVDHYGLNRDYEKSAREFVQRILVIDDLANRPHDCDVLMDQTYGRDSADYQSLVPSHCRILTGPEYALLRPQFAAERPTALERRKRQAGKIDRILVMLGASDPDNSTGLVLAGLERLEGRLAVDVVMGANAPHLAAIREQAKTSSHEVMVYAGTDDVATLMANADLCIGAGGTTSWERCCMGLPTLAIEIADNQSKIIRELAKAGAVSFCGVLTDISPDDICRSVDLMQSKPEQLLDMGRAASRICDGLGTRKLREVIEYECSQMVA